MTDGQRAKIFAPYAALKGFGKYILSAEERGEERILPGEDAQEELNRQLQHLRRGDRVAVTYYREGRYTRALGTVKRLDEETQRLCLDTRCVPLADILAVEKAEE